MASRYPSSSSSIAVSARSSLAAVIAGLAWLIAPPVQAFEVVISFEAELIPGTCGLDCLGALGGTLTGTIVYESTSSGSGTNPRSYPLTSMDFTTSFEITGGASLGTVSIANDVSSPPADAITVAGGGLSGSVTTLTLTYLNFQAIDEDGSVFSTTDLPTSAPSLSAFETAYLNMVWSEGALDTWSPTWEVTSWTTGYIPGGDCCSAHSAPTCDEAVCASVVCAIDAFCCTDAWDSICASRAVAECAICGGGSSAPDCPSVGTGGRAALRDQAPTDPPFGGTALGSADTARGWRFEAAAPDLFVDRLGAWTSDGASRSHVVTLFDAASEAVLAQVTTTPGPGWRWVPVAPIELTEGNDYVVTVHSDVASWLWSGARADIGERWFPDGPIAYRGSVLAIDPDPSAFPTFGVPDSQQGLADVGYSFGSCFEIGGGGSGTVVDASSGAPGQSIDLRVDEAGLVSDLDVSIRLRQNGGAPGSDTWWDDLRMTLRKNGEAYPLNANPTAGVSGAFDVTFDAEAAQSIAAAKLPPGDAVGSYRPDGGVGEPFEGDLLAGVWTLEFEEVGANVNETVLESWSLGGRVLDEPTALRCITSEAPDGGGDNLAFRGLRFAVTEPFQGVRMLLSASAAGTYSFDVELRRSSGFVVAPELTVPLEVELPTTSTFRSVAIDFGEIAVAGAEAFTVKLVKLTGPGSAYVDTLGIGNDPCSDVEVTENNTGSNPGTRADPNHFSVIGLPEPGLSAGLGSGILLLIGATRRRRRGGC